jgi:RNA polymerase sigma factor (sigma-70 family)
MPHQTFEEVVLPHLDAAFNYARWLTKSDADAEDVVQDAYVRALRFFSSLRSDDARAWLFTIVRNTWYGRFPQATGANQPTVYDDMKHDRPDEGLDPEALAMQRQAVEKVKRAVQELPTDFREVIILRSSRDCPIKKSRPSWGFHRDGHVAARARPRTAPGDPRAIGDATGGAIMMCLETGRLLDAFVDHELGPAESAEMQAHLGSCAACRKLLADRESLGRLVRQLPYYPASDQFRAKMLRMSSRPRFNPSLLAWAAVLALAVSLGGSVEVVRFARARHVVEATASVADEVVGDHVRALRDAHLFDVRSSDQHTVKPWFLGKLDFSPPVEDLSSIGFSLVGGRLDHVGGQPVAALVYQRRLHPISVYIWPAADRTAASDMRSIRGFQVRHWIRNGMSFWAVSDLNDAELSEFVRALQG